MSSPFMTGDDLDEGFTPEQDVLDTPETKNQAESDTVIVTKAEKPLKPEVPQTDERPSMNELLSSKLVIIQNQNSKVAQIKDVHDAIVANESIGRKDAELIGLACEDFFGPRLRVTEFSQVPSKINFAFSKNFLEKKIATESAKLAEAIKSFATEDVMQYATFATTEKPDSSGTVNVSDRLEEAVNKGIFVESNKTMVDVASYNIDEFEEAIANTNAPADLRDALCEFCETVKNSKAASFVAARLGGMEPNSAIATATSPVKTEPLTLKHVMTYLNTTCMSDMEYLGHELKYCREEKDSIIESLNETIEDPTEFVNSAKAAISKFYRTEVIEEICIVMKISVKVANKIIEIAKF